MFRRNESIYLQHTEWTFVLRLSYYLTKGKGGGSCCTFSYLLILEKAAVFLLN